MLAQIIAVVIFLAMFVFIVMDKIERQIVTLVCGLLTMALVFGLCMHSLPAIWETLNVKSIFSAHFWYQSGNAAEASTGINWETIIWNGLNIRGIYGRKVWDTWYKMTTMLEAGLDISGIITHRMNIKDYKKGFDAMISGQSGKVILNWEDIDKLEAQSQDC